MRFSVVTITSNAQMFLAQSLESVATQTFVDFEHILWDGGSSDRTLEIAHSFPHVKIYEGKDSGIADAMNRGAAFATGEFLIFLHADDKMPHARVLQMIDATLNLHPQYSWLYGRAKVIDGEGNQIRITPYEPFSFKRLRKYNFITHPSAVVSKMLFQKVGGFDPTLRYCMDYDLWLRLSRFACPLPLPTPLSCFREHQNSLSTREGLQVANEAYRVRNRYVISPLEKLRSYRTWKKRQRHYEIH